MQQLYKSSLFYTIMRQLLIILFITAAQFAVGQNNNCNCPKNDFTSSVKPDKIFSFSNGRKIGLCGATEMINNKMAYTEFILFQCGQQKIINQWGATQSCTLLKTKDTLVVNELFGLAIGKNMTIKWVPFQITKYYFSNSALSTSTFFKKDLPKYSKAQVNSVIKQYAQLTKQTNGDTVLLVAHRLFWAYVSGSKEAATLLNNFEKKLGPFDGAIAEEFSDLWATYKIYKP